MERHLERETCAHCGLMPHVVSSRDRGRVVCASPLMRDLLRKAARFAASEAPVVVFGESGSGKEVVARALHANSPRAQQPVVAVNVAALPTELLESELFGHARGAFTGAHQARKGLFESADGGVLFLDDIGEMPLPHQAKLLRALQEGEIRRVGETAAKEVDVRVVCATHRDLAERVRSGHFREDLYYRLKVLSLVVPPLRERPEDVMPLARQFLQQEKTKAKRFSSAAERTLRTYLWPGNVRELQNAVKYACALAPGEVVEAEFLPDELSAPSAMASSRSSTGGALTQPNSVTSAPARLVPLAEMEREHILGVLAACEGVVTDAARILGVGRNTLWRKLKQYE